MSALDDLFAEEHDRLQRMRILMDKERSQLPKGYLSKKTIKGKPYYYLQKREGDKVKSIFVPEKELNERRIQLVRRKQLDASIKEIDKNLVKLRQVMK